MLAVHEVVMYAT